LLHFFVTLITVGKQSFVVNLSAEKNASELVTRLLEMSEKARKTEELLEQMERERQVSYTLLCATKAAPNTISNYSTNTCHSI